MKKLCFVGGSFFQKDIADIWNFWLITYLGKGLSYLKNWGVGVNYCWNYGPSKLLLHFIEYRIDQLNSEHTKTASKLDNTVFWRLLSKEMSAKSLMFFGPPTTKWRSCKIFTKLNGQYLVNIFKLHECKTFDLMKMHNICKIWFANSIFSLWKSLVYD